jgi:hypothetical protein
MRHSTSGCSLSIWPAQRIGAMGVILGTIISYLVVLIVPQTMQAWKVLYGVVEVD